MSSSSKEKKKAIAALIRTALLEDGPMVMALYDHELAGAVDELYASLIEDKEEFLFAITENQGHVAMVLITTDKTVYKNEAARDQLKALWPNTYAINMEQMIPMVAKDLCDGYLFQTGVKTQAKS